MRSACKSEKHPWRGFVLALGLAVALAPMAAGDDSDQVAIHGFGGWSFGTTDGNAYQVGDDEGKYDNAELTLNVTAKPVSRLTLVGQIQLEEGLSDSDDDVEVDLDFAFAEWRFHDAARLRMGRVKHPFGLYGEIFDVGTLHPFLFLPQSVYGPTGYTAEFYDGVGLAGTRVSPSGWGLQYDLYLGEIRGELLVPGFTTGNPDQRLTAFVPGTFVVTDVVGGRVRVSTPLEGLTVGASAYLGEEFFRGLAPDPEGFDRDTWDLHLEYLGPRLWIRSEAATMENDQDISRDSFYAEVAYKFDQHWQLAARFDDFSTELGFLGDLSGAPSFLRQALEHQELAVGLNYWFSTNLVVKLSLHEVEGNRYALPTAPELLGRALATDDLEPDTRLVAFGAQFSF